MDCLSEVCALQFQIHSFFITTIFVLIFHNRKRFVDLSDLFFFGQNRILAEIEEQAEQLLALVFENYKSLDESVLSGMEEVFRSPSGVPAPALGPAVKLYTLLHDILSQEAQIKLCCYFQTAARKRMRRHLLETDEFINGHADVSMVDVVTFTSAYRKVISLCNNTRDEIFTDIEIHNQHILPRFVN